MGHFRQKLCISCDKSLIRIGDDWYEFKLHENCGDLNANKDDFCFNEVNVKIEVDPFPNWTLPEQNNDDLIGDGSELEKVNLINKASITTDCSSSSHAYNDMSYGQNIHIDYQLDPNNTTLQSSSHINNDQEKRLPGQQAARPTVRFSRNPDYKFECHICQNRYAKKTSLSRHISYVHENDQKYVCKICGRRFIVNSMLKQHLARHKERNEIENWEIPKPIDVASSPKQDIDLYDSTDNKPEADHQLDFDLLDSAQSPASDAQNTSSSPDKNWFIDSNQKEKYDNQTTSMARFSRNPAYKFECHICKNRYANENSLKRHMGYVHENRQKHVCKICGKCYIENTVLKQHLLKHKEVNEGQISELSTQLMHTVQTRPVLVRQRNPEYKFECPICQNRYAKERSLKSHISYVHENIKKYQCNLCKKRFIENFALKQHLARHKNDTAQKVFKCPLCPRTYAQKKFLDYHIAHHDANPRQKRHPCLKCKKVYATNVALKDHMQIVHEGKVLYECKICNKSFKSLGSLNAHELTHSDTYSYVCDNCGKGFHQRGHLDTHMTTHSETRLHACKQCDKKFKTASQLVNHLRTHTGEKLFKCRVDNCTRDYAHSTDFKRHQFNTHGICVKKCVCQLCSKVFAENRSLKKHMESHNII